MDTSAFEVARARALALCRAVAEEPIQVEDALAYLRELSANATSKEEQEEIQALELIFQAVGGLQQIGAALSRPPSPAVLVVPRPAAGTVVVPVPPNVR
jgi:hypothetical protein